MDNILKGENAISDTAPQAKMIMTQTRKQTGRPNVIELRGVDLEFPLNDAGSRSLRRAIFAKSATRATSLRALSGIHLEVKDGERIGLYGPNGSGKTTLLRVLAGIYPPSRGKLVVNGRIDALIGISFGAAPEISVWDNIERLLWLGGEEATEEKIMQIWEWTELNPIYLGQRLKVLSSGMMMKLFFSVITSLNTEILILDEWLGVGDAAFQIKAAQKMDEFIARAKALVIASHNYEMLTRVCDRIVLLEAGKIKDIVIVQR